MTKTEAMKLVAILMGAFPHNKATEATAGIYEELLLDLDAAAAKGAVLRLIATSKFFPSIAEIREASQPAEERRLGLEGWGDVNQAVRDFGRYQVPLFEDHITTECVKQMGWLSLCDSTNETADRARFVELYNGLQERGIRERKYEQLPGGAKVMGLFGGRDIPSGN